MDINNKTNKTTQRGHEVILREYGNVTVGHRVSDGYLNATDMCKAFGKEVFRYNELDSTKEYLELLSEDLKIPLSSKTETGLIQVFQGGNDKNNETVQINRLTINN